MYCSNTEKWYRQLCNKYCEDYANRLHIKVRYDKQHSNKAIAIFMKLGYRIVGLKYQPRYNKQNVVLLKL